MKNEIKQKIIKSINENPLSMSCAAKSSGMPYTTFIYRAKKLGVYNPNQSGKGLTKKRPAIPLNEILANKYPQYQTYKLKIRLIKEGFLENVCHECGIFEWNGKSLSLELHHVDGISNNHKKDNLRLLCPNCHSQTSTFRGKNKCKYISRQNQQ